MIRVGVDVGGTFTDIVLERTRVAGEDDQQVVVTKVPSTPHDQSEGVVAGVLQVCKQAGVAPGEIDVLFHGTTVGASQASAQLLASIRCSMAVKAIGQTTQPPSHLGTSDAAYRGG